MATDAFDHLEAAIAELSKARSAVQRGTSRQVTASVELDRLKSVAFAWFRTHRPGLPDADLTQADAAYQVVLDSTARHAARSTYVKALKGAKDALVALRSTLAQSMASSSNGLASTSDAPPDFSPLSSDPVMRSILRRRWEEIQRCIAIDANLAATVMMGGFLESLLLARINLASDKRGVFTASTAPRDRNTGKTLPMSDWKLIAMVAVAHELGWITKSAKDVGNVLRDFRNYIHPHKEHTDALVLGAEDVQMFWEVCKAICRQILRSC